MSDLRDLEQAQPFAEELFDRYTAGEPLIWQHWYPRSYSVVGQLTLRLLREMIAEGRGRKIARADD